MFHRILANRTLWSKLWLSLWIGVAVTVGWLGYSSADTAATRRLSPTSQAIETIAVGTHVLAENPTDEADHEFGVCVESEDWRKLTLLAQKADGTTADVVLLRPLWWLEAQRAPVGGQVELHAPECGIEGHARVLAIEACPPVTRPPPGYRTVTGTFRHHAAQICRVRSEQLDTTIACTPNHPFWSEDLQQFVRPDELRPGETLRACDRTYQVASVEHSDQPETVFNLEVQVDHTYFVTSTGILVHNAKGDNCKLLASRRLARRDKALYRALGGAKAAHTAHHLIPVSVARQRGLKSFFQRAARDGWDINGARNGLMIDNVIRHVNSHPRYNAYVAQRIQGYITKSGGLKNITDSQARQYLETLSTEMRRFLNNTDGNINELFEWIK